MDASDDEIRALHATWSDAVRRGDLEAALDLVSDDYVLWAPGAAPLVGRDAVRALLQAAMARYQEMDPTYESEECIVVGDLAVDRGWDVQAATVRETGERVTRRQRVTLVIRRSGDGRWRYARGMSQPGQS